MKYISALLSYVRPRQLLLSMVLSTVLFFASGCTAKAVENSSAKGMVQLDDAPRGFPPAAKSATTKGTVQLDKIEQKAEEALDSPANSLKTIEERSQGALNEVQGGAADRNKMSRSNDPKLPVVKQAEKALNKMTKS
jgi:hypothetical protein